MRSFFRSNALSGFFGGFGTPGGSGDSGGGSGGGAGVDIAPFTTVECGSITPSEDLTTLSFSEVYGLRPEDYFMISAKDGMTTGLDSYLRVGVSSNAYVCMSGSRKTDVYYPNLTHSNTSVSTVMFPPSMPLKAGVTYYYALFIVR